MKRRNFLSTVAGLFALPFMPKAKAAVTHAKAPPYKVTVDWARDSVAMPDKHSVMVIDSRSRTRHARALTKAEKQWMEQNATLDRQINLEAWRARMKRLELMGPR